VIRSRRPITPAAANRRVVSTPPKASSASASAPAEPVTTVWRPSGVSASPARICLTTAGALMLSPAIGTESTSAFPSALGMAGSTVLARDSPANEDRSAATAAESCAVIPLSRTYTTTATGVSVPGNASCSRIRARVASALRGSVSAGSVD
jgi:hypothetical protein